jgi:predicted DCC family thiol-disulfide oxidoreductase YuxK
VRFARRRIHAGLAAVPYQGADLGTLGVTRERAGHEVLWAAPGGQVSGGAQAVARLLINAGGAWAVPGALIRFPPLSWLAQAGYRLIAAHRYRLPGGTPQCAAGSGPEAAAGRPAGAVRGEQRGPS